MLDERWSEHEQELADGLRALLDKRGDVTVVRAAESATDGRNPGLERELTQFGLWDLPPEPGLLCAAAWQLGRALAPVSFPERAGVTAFGLDGAVWGERGWAPSTSDDVVMRGAGGRLVRAAVGEPQRSSAGDLLVPCSPTDIAVAGVETADRASRLVRLLVAARAVGAAEGVLAIGVGYAAGRHQFGRPIGSFQAVAHRLADVAIAVDGAALAVRKSAWVASPDQGGDGAPDWMFASIARSAAENAAEAAVTAVHQVMGGYGFTVEEDCQLYSRRTRAWRLRLEPVEAELRQMARALMTEAGRDRCRWLWHHERGLSRPRWAAAVDARV